MCKTLLAMLTATLLCTSLSAMADLENDMDMLKGAYRTVTKTHDVAEFKQALTVMRGAAEDAKTQTPDKLKGQPSESPEMKDYRADLDKLIGQIDVSMKLADAGDLAEAKKAAEKLSATRDASHKKFR